MVEPRIAGSMFNGRRPGILLVVALVLIVLGVVVSPSILIELGPMRTSLTHQNDFVRNVAEVEVLVGRFIFLACGVSALIAYFVWPQLGNSRLAATIGRHQAMPAASVAVSRTSFLLMIAAIAVCLALVAAKGVDPSFAGTIHEEDDLIEYTTAGLFLGCALYSGYLAFRMKSTPSRLVHVALAFGFVLCVGEEISWGQRLLGFDTPNVISSVNAQDEFNLHNSLGYAADHIFIVGIFFFGGLVPLLAASSESFRRLLDFVGFPVASIGLAVGFLCVSLLHDWTVYAVLPITAVRIAELRELISVLGLLLLMWEVDVRRRMPGQPSMATS